MKHYFLTENAEADVQEIFDWIAHIDFRPGVAEKVVRRLYDEFETLAEHPGLCPFLEGFEGTVRKSVVLRYIVLYREVEEGVLVLRVVDGAQDIQATEIL